MKLIGIGDNVADYYIERNRLYPGGSTYNVTVLSSSLGIESAYIGQLGNRETGKFLYRVLKNNGVDVSHVKIEDGFNALARVIVKNGERKFIDIDKGVYTGDFLTEIDFQFLKDFDYLYTTCYSYTEQYLGRFKNMGLQVAFDYSFHSEEKYLRETAPYVDLAFFSSDGVEGNYCKFMEFVSILGPDLVVITLGEAGVIAYQQGKKYFQPAFPVRVVDTLGAGDSFVARFLQSYFRQEPVTISMQKAAKYAAECCQHYGCINEKKYIKL